MLVGYVANGAAETSCIRMKPLSRKSCMAQAANGLLGYIHADELNSASKHSWD